MSAPNRLLILAAFGGLAPAVAWSQADRVLGGSSVVGGDGSRGMLSVDVSGIKSWDDWYSPFNVEILQQVDPNAHIIGIGWDVTISTKPYALLTDVRVLFIGVETPIFSLAPGLDDDRSGTASYSSGDIIDLRPEHFDFHADPLGFFRMHFYQRGDRGDYWGEVNATWLAGTITLQYETVPTPGLPAILSVAGLIAMRRRR
ncbi:MAG: hypothetical protein U0638_15640 [Phycisphaerales bacterium]